MSKTNHYHISNILYTVTSVILKNFTRKTLPQNKVPRYYLWQKNIRWDNQRVAMETSSLIRVNEISVVTDECACNRWTWSLRKNKSRMKIVHWGGLFVYLSQVLRKNKVYVMYFGFVKINFQLTKIGVCYVKLIVRVCKVNCWTVSWLV